MTRSRDNSVLFTPHIIARQERFDLHPQLSRMSVNKRLRRHLRKRDVSNETTLVTPAWQIDPIPLTHASWLPVKDEQSIDLLRSRHQMLNGRGYTQGGGEED